MHEDWPSWWSVAIMDQGFCYKFDKQKVDSYREQKRSDEIATRRCRQPVPKVNKKRIKPRKNRPFRYVREMRLECCNTTCLLNMGRDILFVIRSDFDRIFTKDLSGIPCWRFYEFWKQILKNSKSTWPRNDQDLWISLWNNLISPLSGNQIRYLSVKIVRKVSIKYSGLY